MDVEKCFEFCWNVFEERENSVVWVLVAEGIEDEAFFGYEGVSVSWNPVSSCSRFNAPRNRLKLKPKKAIAACFLKLTLGMVFTKFLVHIN